MRSFVVMRQEIFNIFPRQTVHFQRIIFRIEVTMVTVSKLAGHCQAQQYYKFTCLLPSYIKLR